MPLQFVVKVVPSSGRSAWVIDKSGQLKCFLKSAPEKGKANRELIKLLAKQLRITQNQVVIVAGATERKKRIEVDCDVSFEQLLATLGLDKQQCLFD